MLKPHWLDEDEEDPEKPRLVKATGAADFLIEQYGHLAGHPVWMGIGVNGMYTDEKVLGYIKWALEKRAGTVWVVLAHELAAENKLAFKKPVFQERRASMREGVEHFSVVTPFGRRRVPLFESNSRYNLTPERDEYLERVDEYRGMAEVRKTSLWEKVFEEISTVQWPRVGIMTIEEVYKHVLQAADPYTISTKNLLAEALIQNSEFQADMAALFQRVVPNFWNQIRNGQIYMPSAYRYTIEQIFLTYALLFHDIGLKMGPETEEGPDEIFDKFTRSEYTHYKLPTPHTPQGFIYLQQQFAFF